MADKGVAEARGVGTRRGAETPSTEVRGSRECSRHGAGEREGGAAPG